MTDATQKNSDLPLKCIRCGKPISPTLPHGVCPNCLLNSQLLESSTDRTLDYGSQPLIEHPEKDLSMDDAGNAQWVDPLQPGETVGPFEIIRRLGRGGMGTVYEAQDTENDRRVALKVLSRPVDNTEARQRFLREGRLAASINHPNSVFVFGTYQVDRWSLISMELVNGGTLEQEIRRRGPMPPRKAVDAALQILDGLEAAYSLGVLHRDIKPANCFLSTDGTIKIGDFGLSISTETQPNARITTEGIFLGTPAFSSPEQLRGNALDVRSDIYAFGVTLYYLLTGKTPFVAEGMVKLLALVLESSPATPVSIRSEIPKELSRLVMRCLAKEPGDRFRNYAELRAALVTFSSEVPEPASLGYRTIAGMIDLTFLSVLSFLYTAFPFPDLDDSGSLVLRTAILVYLTLNVLYYAVCEASFGQTLGKKILGLKTIDALGNRPRFSRALIRASVFVLLPVSLTLPYNLVVESSQVSPDQTKLTNFLWLAAIGLSSWVLWAILFSTARLRNGQAGLHDLLSDTRVVSQAFQSNQVQSKSLEAPLSLSDNAQQIGPYHVLEALATNNGSEMLVGYDTVMLRRVWLKRNDEEWNDSAAQYRASLARSTRLRWLNRITSGEELWDVYEAPTGKPLVNRLREPLQWQDIKTGLADVANELIVSIENGTMPKQFNAGHLWITEAGHVKLLDFVAPGAMNVPTYSESGTESMTPTEATPQTRANKLLAELGERIETALASKFSSTLPPPLYVTDMLASLKKRSDFKANVSNMMATVARREVAPRHRRVLMAVAYYALPLTMLISVVAIHLHSHRFYVKNPDICEIYGLGKVLEQSAAFKDGSELEKLFAKDPTLYESLGEPVRQYRRYLAAVSLIAGDKQEILKDRRMQSIPAIMSIHPFMRQQLNEAASSSTPSTAEVAAAKELLSGEIAEHVAQLTLNSVWISRSIFLAISVWCMYVAIPAAIAGILFRGGLILHGFQVTVVRMNGRRAGRFRIFLRSCVAIVPAVVTLAYVATVAYPVGSVEPRTLAAGIAVVVLLALILVSNFFGPRSLPDRILGTAVVAK